MVMTVVDTPRPERQTMVLAPPPRDAAAVERLRVATAVADTRAADQLTATMRLVKAARFNAATRLERKQAVELALQRRVRAEQP